MTGETKWGCTHNERQPVSSTCAAIWAAPACLPRVSSIQLWWATRVHSPHHSLWSLQWPSTRLSANISPRCVKSPTFFRGTSSLNSTGPLWPGFIWPVWPRRCTEWAKLHCSDAEVPRVSALWVSPIGPCGQPANCASALWPSPDKCTGDCSAGRNADQWCCGPSPSPCGARLWLTSITGLSLRKFPQPWSVWLLSSGPGSSP